MKKLFPLLFLSFFFCMQLAAQNRAINGTVLDEKGVPVAGASVTVKQNQSGTVTDNAGKFSLQVPVSARTLVISSVGYVSTELPLQSASTYSVNLQHSAEQIGEVVVTAYGTTQKKSFTGSAATITNEKFRDLQVSTITGVLQGNASGVLAVTSTGQPGESPVIRIRGIGSINASADPLIVVDGAAYGGSLNSLNPNDIESVTVLKDASSTALYGSRAANGVIQITTKLGRGKTKFALSGVSGFSQRAVSDYKTVNANQFYELAWEALRNDALANPALLTTYSVPSAEAYATKVVTSRLIYNPFNVAEPVGTDGKIKSDARLLWNDNWINATTRTGIRNDINGSITGGDPSGTRYFLSGGYIDDQGIIAQSDFKRYTGRLKIDSKATSWLQVGMNTNIAYSTQNYPYQGNGSASAPLSFARNIAPIYPIYLRDKTTGSYVLDGLGNRIYDFGNNLATGGIRPAAEQRPYNPGQNPLGTVTINPNTFDRLTASGNAYGEATLLPGLKFRSQYAIDYFTSTNNLFWNPFYGDGTTTAGLSYRGVSTTVLQTFTNTQTFDRQLGLHHFNILAGQEAVRQKIETTEAQRTGFTFAFPTQPSYGTTSTASGTVNTYRLASYFSRLNYDLTDKYHLSLSLRRDGSTRFAEAVRWGTFYSVGGAWNLSREGFMPQVSFLNDLKLKASYGTAGNQALPGSFPYLGTYLAGANIGTANGVTYDNPANLVLTWETQKQLDMGVEFSLLKNRLTGSFVYYNRISDKLLYRQVLSPSTGFNSVQANIGGMKNYGYEIELNSINISQPDFEWRTSLNITRLKNVLTVLPKGSDVSLEVGRSFYNWFLREWAGVDLKDGMPMWYKDQVDASGKTTKVMTKVYNDATRYQVGNRLPDWTGGLSNSIRYKHFDLTMLAAFSLGGKIYDADYGNLMGTFYSAGLNANVDVLNRWQSPAKPGDGKTPLLRANTDLMSNTASTRFLYDATYMRIRNITVGYRLPEGILGRITATNARFFVDLQNPFTFFNGPTGLDPEAGLNGNATLNQTTTNKTLSVGINLGF
ncbi:MAG: SusC/RagA family TonB-linked outer membrane protein [Williamsia sp.]|nr:SusC/RagA family TonB-linked outer membrane protein [Williamsia sp.]